MGRHGSPLTLQHLCSAQLLLALGGAGDMTPACGESGQQRTQMDTDTTHNNPRQCEVSPAGQPQINGQNQRRLARATQALQQMASEVGDPGTQ